MTSRSASKKGAMAERAKWQSAVFCGVSVDSPWGASRFFFPSRGLARLDSLSQRVGLHQTMGPFTGNVKAR